VHIHADTPHHRARIHRGVPPQVQTQEPAPTRNRGGSHLCLWGCPQDTEAASSCTPLDLHCPFTHDQRRHLSTDSLRKRCLCRNVEVSVKKQQALQLWHVCCLHAIQTGIPLAHAHEATVPNISICVPVVMRGRSWDGAPDVYRWP